ncbi:hypothetical protein MLD52_23445, partial [Puniceicoccaceae bacterium K14]|nr:hypothetical protein [Puniceicoccaceae bacterium K14]
KAARVYARNGEDAQARALVAANEHGASTTAGDVIGTDHRNSAIWILLRLGVDPSARVVPTCVAGHVARRARSDALE